MMQESSKPSYEKSIPELMSQFSAALPRFTFDVYRIGS